MVLVESPAWIIVWCWRHCVLAVGARSGLVPVGAGWDYDAGNRAEEEVGVYAAGRFVEDQPGVPKSQSQYVRAIWSKSYQPDWQREKERP